MLIENAQYTNPERTCGRATINGKKRFGITSASRHWDDFIAANPADYVAPPPKTDDEVDAEAEAFMNSPFMLSFLEAIAPKLTGPTDVTTLIADMKANARKPGRVPRN